MFKYIVCLVTYIVFYLVAMCLAPVLPIFAVKRLGPTDNANAEAFEPRLPHWLFWFSTNQDNSLWGDNGWRTKHCPKYWNTYWGMVQWLWRNPACGFSWSVISANISLQDTYELTDSGRGLDVDKSRNDGWFKIKSSAGYFQYRWVRTRWGKIWTFESGWLLDVYMKTPGYAVVRPRATFMFQPQIKTKR